MERLSLKEGVVLFFYLVFACIIFWIAWTAPFFDPDFLWHTKMGKDLVLKGLSPFQDHYSITHTGRELLFPSVVFDVLAYEFQRFFGEYRGWQIFRGLLLEVPFFIFFLLLRSSKSSALFRILAMLFITCGLIWRHHLRPEMISYSLSLITLILYFEARKNLTDRLLIKLNALLLIWVNIHTSCIFGFIIIGSLYFEKGLRLLQEKSFPKKAWLKLAGWSIATFVIGFLNPSFRHPVLFLLQTDPAWKVHIMEHKDEKFVDFADINRMFWALSLATAALATYRKLWGHLLILIVLLLGTWEQSRLFPHLVVISSALIVDMLREPRQIRKSVLAFMQVSFCFLAFYFTFSFLRYYITIPLSDPTHASYTQLNNSAFPVSVVEYMKKNKLGGNLLNDHPAGGYLIYKSDSDFKVVIDGRTNILYPLSHMRFYYYLGTSPELFAAFVKKYHVENAVVQTRQSRAALLERAIRSGLFGIQYQSGDWALLTKSSRNFPASTRIYLDPGCWQENQASELSYEFEYSKTILPLDSEFGAFLEFAAGYIDSKDKKLYLKEKRAIAQRSDRILQLGGYLSLSEAEYSLAIDYLNASSYKSVLEQLTLAALFAQAKKNKESQEKLEQIEEPDLLNGSYSVIFLATLNELKKQNPISKKLEALIPILEEKAEQYTNERALKSTSTFDECQIRLEENLLRIFRS